MEHIDHFPNPAPAWVASALLVACIALAGCAADVNAKSTPEATSTKVGCPGSGTVGGELTSLVLLKESDDDIAVCFGGSTTANMLWLSDGLRDALATDGPQFPLMVSPAPDQNAVRCDAGPDINVAARVQDQWYHARSFACGWMLASPSASTTD